jgi:hypothetical protein
VGSALVLLISAFAWAQNGQTPSNQSTTKDDYFVKTVYLNKVFPTQYGYVAAYLDSAEQYEQVYLPMSWFNSGSGKGELLFGYNRNYPYMNVWWKNGQFDHVQLYVDSNYHSSSWGYMESDPALQAKFNVDTLKMKF